MKIALVSAFARYSVGKIMIDIAQTINSTNGCDAKIFYAREECSAKNISKKVSSDLKINANAFMARAFDNDGFCLFSCSDNLIRELELYKPDIVHLHCLHGYYLNAKKLFIFLKKNEIKVIWTMHDAWAITGHCCYFSMIGCDKWKNACYKCPQKKEYPKSIIFDFSKNNYKKKKEIFTSLVDEQMVLVTPSKWLKNIIGESYLKKYRVEVINNDINKGVFNSIPSTSAIKTTAKHFMLGVASVWDKRKGLEYFLGVAKTLPSDWQAVVIGKIEVDVKLPDEIIYIERTNNQEELKAYYQKCSFLFNPTLDDNYPTVNLEAQACGAKVITFDTGGSIETDLGNLYVVDKKTNLTFDDLYKTLSKEKSTYSENISEKMANRYLRLYKEVLEDESVN